MKFKQILVETPVSPGRTSRTRIANRSLIPRCVQRQHTAAWRPAQVILVARQQFTDEGGYKGGPPLLPTPLTVLRHHHVKIKSAWPWIIDFLFLSINSFLRWSELSFQLSVVPALSDTPSVLFDCVVTVLIQCFLILRLVTMLRVTFSAFCCPSCWNFQRSAKGQGEFF